MPELRWILLVVGAVAIVGIYLWSRREGGKAATDDETPGRREPVLDEPAPPWDQPARSPAPAISRRKTDKADEPAELPPAPPPGEELIVVLRVRARGQDGFSGAALAEVFAQEGLQHGALGAFHSLEAGGRSRFMVARLTEPGSFDPETMTEEIIPGVSLFMVLPGPADPPTTLDAMIGFARRLAGRLGGEVLDEKGNALTPQEAGYLREKVVEYWRRVRIGAHP